MSNSHFDAIPFKPVEVANKTFFEFENVCKNKDARLDLTSYELR
jgi:hypothetical protein